MDEKKFNDALEALKIELEGKSKIEVDKEIKTFEEKYKDTIKKEEFKPLFDTEVKAITDDFEAKFKAQQEHLDKLDVKSQSNKVETKTPSVIEEIRKGIKDNFDSIKVVKKGNAAQFEIKTVGNMVTANVTGDEERDFSNIVAKLPGQKVAFSDLVGVIPIDGGTYTFPREAAGEYTSGTAFRAQTEGSAKDQRDYDFTHVDVTTDFIAGFARYSKKMANNVRYLEGFLPEALRRDYMKSESSIFNTVLLNAATASAQAITGQNKSEMLMNEIATLEGSDWDVNAIVLTTADYYDILQIEKSTGAGYGLPLGWSFDGGVLRCLGIAVVKANWLATNKYYVGDFNQVKKIVTEGLSLQFSTEDTDNFTKNNITARIEAQVGLAVHQPSAIIYGDFSTT